MSGAAVAHVLIAPVSPSPLDAQTRGVGVGRGVMLARWVGCGGVTWGRIPDVTSHDTAPNTTTKPASHAKSLDRLGWPDVPMCSFLGATIPWRPFHIGVFLTASAITPPPNPAPIFPRAEEFLHPPSPGSLWRVSYRRRTFPDARVGKRNFVGCRLGLATADPLASFEPLDVPL